MLGSDIQYGFHCRFFAIFLLAEYPLEPSSMPMKTV
jgi:hypothetical protein